MSKNNPLILRRLYRSLLKASQPFTTQRKGFPSPAVMTCLLHRTGAEDRSWPDFLRGLDENDEGEGDDEDSTEDRDARASSLFSKLLRKVVAGAPHGVRQMQVPAAVDCGRLQQAIRREFRRDSDRLDPAVRREVGFRALRALHKKLAYAESLKPQAAAHPQQAARNVHALPLRPPSSYLRPGAYLLAHPLLPGYFRRSVICILDHADEENDDDGGDGTARIRKSYGTYGLIVNRTATHPVSCKTLTLPDVLKPLALPDALVAAFGGAPLREGGPVHFSLQMLHASTAEREEETQIGGCVLPTVPVASEDQSTATDTDKAVYYRGSVPYAAKAIEKGRLDQDDLALFLGCSVWSEGQLEGEIERGSWLPCSAPAAVALTGICDHEPPAAAAGSSAGQRPEADLWLSMMSALGEHERELAHWVFRDDGEDENGAPCDA